MMKTHGGRAFLHGHMFGDNVHEFLAPCIYEGEGEMLGMAFFKSLVKQHGTQFFEPIGKALAAAGVEETELAEPGPCLGLARAAAGVLEMVCRPETALARHAHLPADAQGAARLTPNSPSTGWANRPWKSAA